MSKVLAVDDEKAIGQLISRILSAADGYEVSLARDGKEALHALDDSPDLILLDVNLPDINGLDLLNQIKGRGGSIPVVVMTGRSCVETAVRAMKEGAVDFIEKPFRPSELRAIVGDVLKRYASFTGDNCGIVGSSKAIKGTMSLINKFATSDISVLLQGETGVGKELYARAIHAKSDRRDGPFVPLDCATLSENLFESELFGHEKGSFTGSTGKKLGKFERADGGTLFIDEVENLSPATQAKLLRVIQEKVIERVGGTRPIKVDVRIVAAANVDLMDAVRSGDFRSDLYYRFTQAVIAVPPLRERKGDIEELVSHFLKSYSSDFGKKGSISREAIGVLQNYDWPGNVRELENVVRSAAILADGEVQAVHLPQYLTICRVSPAAAGGGGMPFVDLDEIVNRGLEEGYLDIKSVIKDLSNRFERSLIQKILERSNMNMSMVAEFLNIDPKTLRAKVRSGRRSRNQI